VFEANPAVLQRSRDHVLKAEFAGQCFFEVRPVGMRNRSSPALL
jgi:hypothetical protein